MSDFGYYLGTDNGEIMLFSSAGVADVSATITAQMVTKRLDFSDQHPDLKDRWKTLHAVKVFYVDLGAVSITVSVSTDGAQTWTDSSATTIGTAGADEVIKTKTFWFIVTGQFFNIKIAHAQATGSSKIVQVELEIEEAGEHFEV